MLENDSGGSSMATHKETETSILKLFKGFEVGRGQFGNGQTIFKLGTNKGCIDLGT